MLLRCPRFGVGEFDFENRAPRHLGNACCHHSCCKRNVVWNIVLYEIVVPLRATEICGDRLIVLCIEKRVGCVSRNRQRDGYCYNSDSVHAHATILNGDGLIIHARIFSVSLDAFASPYHSRPNGSASEIRSTPRRSLRGPTSYSCTDLVTLIASSFLRSDASLLA